MKDFYAAYLNDDLWLIKQTEWVTAMQNIRETQFTLGNGYMGTRGVLQDMPEGAAPGLFLAGVYDNIGSQVDELVNLPNPINFMFTVDGQKLDVIAMDVLEHKRVLNMKKALLVQHTVYRDRKKRRHDYQSLRFISMRNKNVGVLQIMLTPLDGDCTIDINTGIDVSVTNAGILSEGKKKHFRVRNLGQEGNAGYVLLETLQRRHIIVVWGGFYYEIDGRKVFAKDNIFQLDLKKGQTVIFTKLFFIKHYPYTEQHEAVKRDSAELYQAVFQADFSSLLTSHIAEWEALWQRADIRIKGTANIQQNLRFNIYHMLICGHLDDGFSSIGARTLSGEGYRGHIFWDTEIFLFPFFLFTFPEYAKNMLLYRYRTLDAARELARREGYKGAKFAWESAATGDEETPEWARDLDGTIIRIHTQEMEHHITADIAYAVYQYYVVTGDEAFMEEHGYEMLFETARFWASRVTYNSKTQNYDIADVIGPDEIHIKVKNNAFTNGMAQWNLITAYKAAHRLKKHHPCYIKIKEKIKLENDEISEWGTIAHAIKFTVGKNNVIEQHSGYSRLKQVVLEHADENGLPFIPKHLKGGDLAKTQLIKQADVLMLLHVLDDAFDDEIKKANYEFYIGRTLHASSLSPAIHSIIACHADDMQRAYNFFNVALRADISNVYRNTKDGIHAASLGGTWQAVVLGFAGVRMRKEKMCINPNMPQTWYGIEFSLVWKNNPLHFNITNDTIKVRVDAKKKDLVELKIFNKKVFISPNRWHTFKRHIPAPKRDYVCY